MVVAWPGCRGRRSCMYEMPTLDTAAMKAALTSCAAASTQTPDAAVATA
ncbi:hypothetical protein GCM10023263_27980 [Phytohabitans rumicis]